MIKDHPVKSGEAYKDASMVYLALSGACCQMCVQRIMTNMQGQGYYILHEGDTVPDNGDLWSFE